MNIDSTKPEIPYSNWIKKWLITYQVEGVHGPITRDVTTEMHPLAWRRQYLKDNAATTWFCHILFAMQEP